MSRVTLRYGLRRCDATSATMNLNLRCFMKRLTYSFALIVVGGIASAMAGQLGTAKTDAGESTQATFLITGLH